VIAASKSVSTGGFTGEARDESDDIGDVAKARTTTDRLDLGQGSSSLSDQV
jgi:hypothetical protein